MAFTGPDPISSCGCSCSSATKVSEPALFLPSRGCDGVETCSDDGVRYFNGELQYAVRALTSGWWAHTLVYSNRLNEDKDFGNGINWMVKEWWQLFDLSSTNEILVLRGSQSALWFDDSGASPVAEYGSLHQLKHDTTNGVYILVCRNGTSAKFHDFTHATAELRGKMTSQTMPGGQEIAVSYDGSNRVSEITASFTSGSSTTTEKFVYTYTGSQIATITLQRKIDSGNFTDLRRVRFEYYTSDGDDGTTGDLKMVVTQYLCPSSSSSSSSSASDQWRDHDFYYFRYYTGASSSSSSSSSSAPPPYDFAHGLKYAVGPQGCERIGPSTLESEDDSVIAANADHYVEYDTDRRVTKNVVASGGFAFEYSYQDSSFSSSSSSSSASDATNSWVRRTTRQAPDDSYIRVYTNDAGQVMLQQLSTGDPDVSAGDRWIEYQTFSADYHLTMRVSPSGIDMSGTPYSEASPSLSVQQKSSEGLFRLWEYGDGSPEPDGYLVTAKVREGTGGTAATVRALSYSSQSLTVYSNSFTIYKLDSQTAYRTAPASDAIATNFTYTWHGSTAGVNQRTIQLPPVPTSQNGTGSTVYRRELYDIYGNQTAMQDERGYITTFTHDLPTGAVKQTVQDATPGSTGWSRPTGAPTALQLTTDNSIDDEGRVTQSLGPQHSVDIDGTVTDIRSATWNVYRDHCETQYDETWSAQGYVISGNGQPYLVNPVSISRAARDGLSSDRIVATRGTTVVSSGALSEDDSFDQSTWVRWTHDVYIANGEMTTSRLYHDIPSSGDGSSGTNYNDTTYKYNAQTGRQDGVVTPRGTITRTVFDKRGLVTSTWIGTNDTGFTYSNPTNSGSGGNNLVQLSENVYDDGVEGGNGNLTTATAYADASDTRVTEYDYDYRNRQEKAGHSDGTYTTYSVPTYDNLNQVTKVERYYDPTSGADVLLAKSETDFDNMGRVYESRRYSVEDGSEGPYLVDKTWHDDAGNVINTVGSSSEAFTKTTYDAVGRVTRTQMGYEVSSSSSSSSSGSSLDKIFAQTDTTYDKASNVTETESLARYHDFTGTGDLSANTNARPTYTAYYPDGIGRTQAVAQYGTNGESTFTRPTTIPTRSDTILVNSTTYNIRGEAEEQTDPRGIVTREEFDDAGRRTTRIENYVSASSSSSSSTCWTDDQNVTTSWTYNASGAVDTVTVHNASTGNQTTTYVYGVTVAGGSKLESNDILHQIQFPGGTTSATFEYNRQGERIKVTDQNGTIHTFSYDKSGRLTNDQVTFAIGTAIDQTIDEIATVYDERGRVYTVTDYYSADDSVHSQIRNEYNGLDMLVRQYQEHIGVVRPVSGSSSSSSSGSGPSLYVDFNFDDSFVTVGDEDVYTKGLRPTSIVYPSGRYVYYNYGTSGGDDDKLSRIAAIVDDDGSTTLASYEYLGTSRVVIEDYEQPQVKLDYTTIEGSSSSSSSSGASTKYPGFDRFDRVVKHQWYRYGGTPAEVDRFDYTYDRNSNPLTKQSYACTNTSELRTYDGLNRLKTYKRGPLSGGTISSPMRQEDFSLDPTANWKCYDVSGSEATALVQTQTHNVLNEITAINETTGPAWFEPDYDANGNMIQCPQPALMTDGFDLTFDAWNRAVEVQADAAVIARYQYDAASRRIVKHIQSASTYEHFCYARSSLPIESWRGASASQIPPTYHQQYVCQFRGIPVLLDRTVDTPPGSSSSSSSSVPTQPSRLYLVTDADGSAASLVDPIGAAVERYTYDAYGYPRFLSTGCGELSPQQSAYGLNSLYAGSSFDVETKLSAILKGSLLLHPVLGIPLTAPPILSNYNFPSYGGSDFGPIANTQAFAFLQQGKERFDPADPCPDAKETPQNSKTCQLFGNPKKRYGIHVKVAQNHADFRADPNVLGKGVTSVKGMIREVFRDQYDPFCDCIKRFSMLGHGSPTHMEIIGVAAQEHSDSRDMSKATMIRTTNVDSFAAALTDMFCFCKRCFIILQSCQTGFADYWQRLSEGTGCTVLAPLGFCPSPGAGAPISEWWFSSDYEGPYKKWIELPPEERSFIRPFRPTAPVAPEP